MSARRVAHLRLGTGEHILAALTQADDALAYLNAQADGLKTIAGPGCKDLEGDGSG